MSLYLFIPDEDGDEEIAGWQLGHYSDFAKFRDTIATNLRATDYPTLMDHSDCDGEWSVTELPQLTNELQSIAAKFRTLPPIPPQDASEHRDAPAHSLYDCFHNVDGVNLFEALIDLCDQGIQAQRPIIFQ